MTIHRGTRPITHDQALAFNPNWCAGDLRLILAEIGRLEVDGFTVPPSGAHINLMQGSTRLAFVTCGRIIYQPGTPAPEGAESLDWAGRYRYLCVYLSTSTRDAHRPSGFRLGSTRGDEWKPPTCPSCFMALTPAGSCPSGCED